MNPGSWERHFNAAGQSQSDRARRLRRDEAGDHTAILAGDLGGRIAEFDRAVRIKDGLQNLLHGFGRDRGQIGSDFDTEFAEFVAGDAVLLKRHLTTFRIAAQTSDRGDVALHDFLAVWIGVRDHRHLRHDFGPVFLGKPCGQFIGMDVFAAGSHQGRAAHLGITSFHQGDQ